MKEWAHLPPAPTVSTNAPPRVALAFGLDIFASMGPRQTGVCMAAVSLRRVLGFSLWLVVIGSVSQARAQTGEYGRLLSETERRMVRAGQVGIVTGNPGGTYIQLARDMAVLLDARGAAISFRDGAPPLRVMPIVGRGSACNLEDVINLRGVDVAIVQHDVLVGMRRNPRYARIDASIRYITTLYREEVHILARDGIRKIGELAGKRVAVGEVCSGSELTGSNVFALAGIDARLVTIPNERAIRALLRGDVDAIVAVGGRPLRFLRDISPAEVTGNRLGFVDLAEQGQLLDGYFEARLEPRDYPALIAPDTVVSTRAVTAVLAVYDWPRTNDRFASTATFVRALFDNLDRLRDTASGFSEKWREVEPRRELAGWRRFDVGSLPEPMSEACRESFHAELRRSGIEPAEMPAADYAERRARFRGRGSSPCR